MPQLDLFGSSEENKETDRIIDNNKEWRDNLKWIVSDECKWNEYEKSRWLLHNGGDLNEKPIDEQFRESISLIEKQIADLEQEKTKMNWGLK